MAQSPFRSRIPADRRYDPEYDMWFKADEGATTVTIGASAFGIHLAGRIIGFTAKPQGASIERRRGLETVEYAKTVLAVHAPVGFTLIEANEAAEENPLIINCDPYEQGWMVRGWPLDFPADVARLVDAVTYIQHIRRMEPGAVFE